METLIRTTIEQYVSRLSDRNTAGLEQLLHPGFTVYQVSPDNYELRCLDRQQYLGMITENKAGGDVYTIQDLTIQYVGYTAMASYVLQGKQTTMHVFLQLVQAAPEEWKILSNTPVVTACPH
jgi:hypothetical protein